MPSIVLFMCSQDQFWNTDICHFKKKSILQEKCNGKADDGFEAVQYWQLNSFLEKLKYGFGKIWSYFCFLVVHPPCLPIFTLVDF